MATTFLPTVKHKRKDGLYAVYIRVTHNRKSGYIATDKLVNDKGIKANGEICDPYVLKFCSNQIVKFIEMINKVNSANWTVRDVIDYLICGSADISFSEYARKHRDKLINKGQERNARNYQLAVEHLERFVGTTNIMFSQLTSKLIEQWIESLAITKRAKEMYPICVRQIFRAAISEINDYDNGIIRITTNPWTKVKIPKADRAEKLAITPEECRVFFSAPLPTSKMVSPLPELGRDVAMLVLCLAGINTVDLFNLKKSDYRSGIISYHRAKTKKFRADGAYMEMRVPAIIQPLFDKYRTNEEDIFLFDFHNRYSTSDSFSANVNNGIKKICASLGMLKENWYCVYTFRHTWGTIAQNDCGASIHEVALAMNHSAGHNVTRGYLKLNFEPAWILNEKVVELIFFTEKKSKRVNRDDDSFSRFSAKYLMRGELFFRGRLLGVVEDIGFDNINQIIAALAHFIDEDIPPRVMLQYKITNLDKEQIGVYERIYLPKKCL